MRAIYVLIMIAFLGASVRQIQAAEATTDQLLVQLQNAVSQAVKEAKEKSASAAAPSGSRQVEMLSYLPQAVATLKPAMERGDFNTVRQTLQQLQMALPGEEIQKLSNALLDVLQKDQAAKEKAAVETVDALVDKTVKTCFAAKEPKELDGLIIELSRFSQRQNDSYSQELSRRAYEKARTAMTFACRWQDYLMQMKSGNTAAAQAVLKGLAQDTSSYPFVPRSEILDRVKDSGSGGTEKKEEVPLPKLEGRTLKDLPALREETDKLIAANSYSEMLVNFSQGLDAFEAANDAFKNGLIGRAYSYCVLGNSYGNKGEQFLALRQQLLILVLPPYLEVASAYPSKPAELPSDYLQRVVEDARTKGDWNTTWRALEAYQDVVFPGNPPAWLNGEIQGSRSYLVGLNQEKAGQYADAVRSYRIVISCTGKNLPVQAATDRLNALQKEHPTEYEDGIKPLPPSYGSGYSH